MKEFLEDVADVLEKRSNNQHVIIKSGIGPLGLLGVAFIVMKLIGSISWSWWWVLAPFWAPVALGIILVILVLLVILVIICIDAKKEAQEEISPSTAGDNTESNFVNAGETTVNSEETATYTVTSEDLENYTTKSETADAEAPKTKKVKKPRKKKANGKTSNTTETSGTNTGEPS